jgi:anti-sigma regulatory factor (Ser/Thr protein kinase)
MSQISGATLPASLRLALLCDLKEVRSAAQTARQFLTEQGCSEDILSACDLALVEACNNAIKYAPAKMQTLPVVVDVLCTDALVELRVTDHTPGFEWPKKIDLPDPESESRRGLYLIQSLMDSTNYLRGDGENVLVLCKSRPAPATGENPQRTNQSNDDSLIEELQKSLLLKELPRLPGFELAALCRSASRIGGDFFDVLKISDGTALLVIADVMGKGVLSAIFAVLLRTVLHATPELASRPAALLARVNRLLFDSLSDLDMFITAQLAFVDAKGRNLVVASAGHCPLLIANGECVRGLSPDGMPLGVLADAVFASETVELPPHCRVLLYTDGLIDALNADGQHYGHQRLSAWLTSASGTAAELKEELAKKLAQFRMKTGLIDDQTFLIMIG